MGGTTLAEAGSASRVGCRSKTDGEICGLSIFEVRSSFEKSPRVFVLGILENLCRRPVLDKATVVHDRDSPADLADHFEVV